MRNFILKTTILTLSSLLLAVFTYGQLTANFTASVTSGCSPLVVNFGDQSTGSPVSWFWDFGNGATSTLKNPSTTYFKEGVYNVKLTVKNAQGISNTLTRTGLITIFGKPAAAFSVSDSSGCFPVRAQFTDISAPSAGTTNTIWFWDFGDGTQSTQQNPLHVYNTSGNFAVTLKITNDKGCYSVLTKPAYIKVTDGVRSGFTNTQAAICKPPFSITFNATSTGSGNLTYLWDFGDGTTSNAQNPSHSYTTTGNYNVSLATISSLGCADTMTKAGLINTSDINNSFNAPATICIYDSAQFQNVSTPKPVSMLWNFGDGTNSTDSMPKKKYSTPGTYTVLLYNTYSYCSDSVSQKITVAAKPVANFTADNTFKCSPPFTVNFGDQTGSATSWQWNFGDGATSSIQNPSHTYNDFGIYSVQLIATNASGCVDSIKKDSLIKIIKPIITIPALPARGCIPYTINPVATIITLDNVTSYLWDFGDGTPTSSLATPSHTYTNQGTYTVTLTITTSTGCTEIVTIPSAVKVGTKPIVNFSAAQTTVCAFQALLFTDLTNVADEWFWNFGDGTTSTAQNPVHSYEQVGNFTVSLTATNNGCPVTFTLPTPITSKPPIARFDFTSNCNKRLEFNFTNTSIGAISSVWNFGDGKTSTDPNPIHSFPSLGTYNVTLTVVNDTCSNSITQAVKVIDEKINFYSTDTVLCKVAQLQLRSIIANPANISDYYWIPGNGSVVSGFPAINSTYAVSGIYSPGLITTDIYGCKDTVTKTNYIKVNGPTAGFNATNTSGCKGLVTSFSDLSTSDGRNNIVKKEWDFGDGTITVNNNKTLTHTYKSVGTYSVKLIVTDATGCKDSLTLSNLVTTTNPIADFSVDTLSCPNSNLNFTNTSTSGSFTSVWNLGDGTTATTNSTTHFYKDTGRYSVKLKITDQFNCSDSTIKTIRVSNPIASFVLSDSISSCAPFEVQFTNTSYYTTSLVWNLGQGTSNVADPVQYYINPGTYPISLVVTSPGGCTDTAYSSITLYDTIGTRVSYGPLNGCSPLNVDLNTFTKGPVNYTWDFGDGIIIDKANDTVSHVYDFFGDFVPKVIMTDPSGCVFPVSGLDTIHIIGAVAKFDLDKKLFCDSGMVIILDSTTFNDTITSYTWNFGDGGTSTLQNPGSHYYSSPGNYTVSLNLVTQNNCRDTFTLQNVVKVVESPLIAVTGDTVICVNDPMNHFGVFQRPDTSAVQWQWQLGNGNSSTLQNPPLQQYATAGNFAVTAVATNSSGCRDSATKNILVNPLPVVTMPASLTKIVGTSLTIPASFTSNVISYNWSPPATLNCSDCPQPETNTKFNTKYTVAFVDSNGCRNTGQIQVIVVCPNANVFVPNTFSPNGDGSNDIFYVRGRGLERVKTLRIFNRWGEVVFERNNFPVNDELYGWNGTYKGNKPHPDVYVYQVEVFCENSDLIRFEGNVALIQ